MEAKVYQKVKEFFRAGVLRRFKKGELLFRPEQTPQGVYCLTEGVVRQYSISSYGEEFVINVYKSPSFFPLAWVFNDKLPNHYYEAMCGATTRCVRKGKFLRFLRANPDVLLDLVQRIYVGLDGYMLRLESMMTGDAYARLIVELLINAKRFGEKIGDGAVVGMPLTQDELAAESGIARETVSREMKKLKDKGLARFEKHRLVIPCIAKLEEELSPL